MPDNNPPKAPQPIRPALDTLRELDGGKFLDKLAAAIHDATGAVTLFGKPGKIAIKITVAPFTKGQLTEPAITMKARIEADLPEADDRTTLFFVTIDGNPSKNQQRQAGLDLQIASATGNSTDAQPGSKTA